MACPVLAPSPGSQQRCPLGPGTGPLRIRPAAWPAPQRLSLIPFSVDPGSPAAPVLRSLLSAH